MNKWYSEIVNEVRMNILCDGKYIAKMVWHDDAEKIIREHNTYIELVNALESFVKNEGYDRKDIREMLVKNAVEALKKAKG